MKERRKMPIGFDNLSHTKREIAVRVLQLALMVAILAVVVPTVIASGYTYLCEDDFSFEGSANETANKLGAFQGALDRMQMLYNVQQGNYTFLFVIHYLRAYTRWGITGFHAVMILNVLLFVLSLAFLIKMLIRHRTGFLLIVLCVMVSVFSLPGTHSNVELFLNYTCALNYTWEMSLYFFSAIMCLQYLRESKTWIRRVCFGTSALAGFLASGGSLNVVAFGCVLLLLISILGESEPGKRVLSGGPFFCALVGALIDVMAPGNRIKSESAIVEGHSTILDALRDLATCYHTEFAVTYLTPVFVLLWVLVLATCVFFHIKILKRNVSSKWLIIVLLGVVIGQLLTIFPVVYGYHSAELLALRTTASCRIAGRLLAFFLAAVLAQWMQEQVVSEKKRLMIAGGITALILSYCLVSGQLLQDVKEGHAYRIMSDFKSGRMLEAYKSRIYVLSAMEMAPRGTDFFVVVPLINGVQSMYGMGLSTDPEYFVNRSAAGLYDLNSVTVHYEYYDL